MIKFSNLLKYDKITNFIIFYYDSKKNSFKN